MKLLTDITFKTNARTKGEAINQFCYKYKSIVGYRWMENEGKTTHGFIIQKTGGKVAHAIGFSQEKTPEGFVITTCEYPFLKAEFRSPEDLMREGMNCWLQCTRPDRRW